MLLNSKRMNHNSVKMQLTQVTSAVSNNHIQAKFKLATVVYKKIYEYQAKGSETRLLYSCSSIQYISKMLDENTEKSETFLYVKKHADQII